MHLLVLLSAVCLFLETVAMETYDSMPLALSWLSTDQNSTGASFVKVLSNEFTEIYFYFYFF